MISNRRQLEDPLICTSDKMSTISSWNSVSKKARKDFHKSSETTDDKYYQDFLGKFEYIKGFVTFSLKK